MKRRILFFIVILLNLSSFAQVNEVTLTVVGTGNTENEATLQALRSAIEQSFGTFVSANTTILNDQLVRDEIVSVSSGNVKEFDKLAVSALPNGQVSVSLRATISVNKLISYAKSKGSKAEFAGQAYAANVKLLKLQAQSTLKAYELMVSNLEEIAKNMFDFSISLSQPILFKANQSIEISGLDPHDYMFDEPMYVLPTSIGIYNNIASNEFYMLLNNTKNALKITDEQVEEFTRNGIEVSNDYSTMCYYPIPKKKKIELDRRIITAIEEATSRFKIYEIGDRRLPYSTWLSDGKMTLNRYRDLFVRYKYSRDDIPVPFGSVFNRKSVKEILHWDSKYEFLKLPVCKRRVKLTSQQEKEVKKGTYMGPLYEEYLGEPTLIGHYKVYLYIKEDHIENFNGFELEVN